MHKIMLRQATINDVSALETYLDHLFAENLPTVCPRISKPTFAQMQSWVANHAGDSSVIFLAEHEKIIIGTINLTRNLRPNLDHIVGLGLNVHRNHRGKGIGTELLKIGLAWFNAENSLERIELEVTSNNDSAIYLYKKFGFSIEGTKRQAVKKADQYLDLHIMGLTKHGQPFNQVGTAKSKLLAPLAGARRPLFQTLARRQSSA